VRAESGIEFPAFPEQPDFPPIFPDLPSSNPSISPLLKAYSPD
jgi:hypothetical protein